MTDPAALRAVYVLDSAVAPGAAGDPLGEFLARLHFPGWRVGIVEFEGPQRLEVEPATVWFYLSAAGDCEINVHAEPRPLALRRGDAAIIASRSRHELIGGRQTDFDVSGSPAATTKILYGCFTAGTAGGHPLEPLLPAAMAVAAAEQTGPQRCDGFVDWLAAEAKSTGPGSAAVVSRFLQSLLVETLRTYLADSAVRESSRPAAGSGPLQAALDPCLGSVLRLVHAAPERDWTVHSMARESGLSRSAFADRFRTIVGQPPLQYVTEIRMQKASELLETTDIPVKRIAALVGYESVSAFSSAFKRRFGGPPVSMRPRVIAPSSPTGRKPRP